MKIKIIFSFIVIVLISLCCTKRGPNQDVSYNKNVRVISFSGYNWIVENSGLKKHGPGPNYFSDSDENVWIDSLGQLHLKITYKDGKWNCAKVILAESYGYNKYVFKISSRIDILDKNVVVGLFTYLNDSAEIDIEFSRWGKADNMNSQYAIQPSYKPENKHRFNIDYNYEFPTVHIIDWQQNAIDFYSFTDEISTMSENKDTIDFWSYKGADIPTDDEERIKINLWLFKGKPPSDITENELVVKEFKVY